MLCQAMVVTQKRRGDTGSQVPCKSMHALKILPTFRGNAHERELLLTQHTSRGPYRLSALLCWGPPYRSW